MREFSMLMIPMMFLMPMILIGFGLTGVAIRKNADKVIQAQDEKLEALQRDLDVVKQQLETLIGQGTTTEN